jgi:SulP family sulfate permease
MSVSVNVASFVHRSLPLVKWIGAYRREWLLPDVFAGAALWTVMVPEAMAYSSIVGVPPIMGLYTIVPALIAYALLGTSRQLVVGPDTATGLISALTVGAFAAQGTAEYNTLTSTLAVLIGAFFLIFGILRMGWVAAFVSTPVMRGFVEGACLCHHRRPSAASAWHPGRLGQLFHVASGWRRTSRYASVPGSWPSTAPSGWLVR